MKSRCNVVVLDSELEFAKYQHGRSKGIRRSTICAIGGCDVCTSSFSSKFYHSGIKEEVCSRRKISKRYRMGYCASSRLLT